MKAMFKSTSVSSQSLKEKVQPLHFDPMNCHFIDNFSLMCSTKLRVNSVLSKHRESEHSVLLPENSPQCLLSFNSLILPDLMGLFVNAFFLNLSPLLCSVFVVLGQMIGKDFKKCCQNSSGTEKLFSVWKQYVEVRGSESVSRTGGMSMRGTVLEQQQINKIDKIEEAVRGNIRKPKKSGQKRGQAVKNHECTVATSKEEGTSERTRMLCSWCTERQARYRRNTHIIQGSTKSLDPYLFPQPG